jgi:hypothetical protein
MATEFERQLIRALHRHTNKQFGKARWDLIQPLFPDIPAATLRRYPQTAQFDPAYLSDVPEAVHREIRRLREIGFDLEHLLASFPGIEPDAIAAVYETLEAGDGEPVDIDEEGNYLEIGLNEANNVKTLEDLLREAAVDLDVWRCEKHEIKTWPTTAKNKYTQTLISRRNWQVNARFVRINPVPILPAVQPVGIDVEIPAPGRAATGGKREGIHAALILTDPQFGFRKDIYTGALDPFHDRAALDVALQIAQALQPDRIIWVGDMEDLPDWSDRFLRSPEFYWSTQPGIIETVWWLAQFRLACPDAKIEILEGNHDKRLEDALLRHLPAAYNLHPPSEMHLPPAMSIPRLLDLERLHIEYVPDYPNGQIWLNEAGVVIHGDVARGQSHATVSHVVKASDVTVIQGHIHRLEWASRTIHGAYGRRPIYAFCPGCLCRVDGIVPGAKARQNWQQGIAVVYHDDKTELTPVPIPIRQGRAIFDGVLYEARNRLEDLRRDTDWNF